MLVIYGKLRLISVSTAALHPHIPILGQINYPSLLLSCIFKINFNFILPPTKINGIIFKYTHSHCALYSSTLVVRHESCRVCQVYGQHHCFQNNQSAPNIPNELYKSPFCDIQNCGFLPEFLTIIGVHTVNF